MFFHHDDLDVSVYRVACWCRAATVLVDIKSVLGSGWRVLTVILVPAALFLTILLTSRPNIADNALAFVGRTTAPHFPSRCLLGARRRLRGGGRALHFVGVFAVWPTWTSSFFRPLVDHVNTSSSQPAVSAAPRPRPVSIPVFLLHPPFPTTIPPHFPTQYCRATPPRSCRSAPQLPRFRHAAYSVRRRRRWWRSRCISASVFPCCLGSIFLRQFHLHIYRPLRRQPWNV